MLQILWDELYVSPGKAFKRGILLLTRKLLSIYFEMRVLFSIDSVDNKFISLICRTEFGTARSVGKDVGIGF